MNIAFLCISFALSGPFVKGFSLNTYPNCSKLEKFARSLSEFTYCSLTYTVPYNLCRKCLNQYQRVRTEYQSILNPIVTGSDNGTCPQDIISRDKLANIEAYFSRTKSIWSSGNCDNCYDMLSRSDEHNLDVFFELVAALDACILTTESNITCSQCRGNYTELSKFYLMLNSAYGNSMCYDVIDTMGLVRQSWQQDLNCLVDHSYDYPTMAIAVLVFSCIPVVFYSLGRCYCRQKVPKLIQQKRMSSANLLNERTKIFKPVTAN
ncbi:Osteopetrosis-associated transmembrane protein 1 [Halotydeus destructor]|nr:Osteopetrosis-associated transmembrane protein 1 [Halotydeus destructor]